MSNWKFCQWTFILWVVLKATCNKLQLDFKVNLGLCADVLLLLFREKIIQEHVLWSAWHLHCHRRCCCWCCLACTCKNINVAIHNEWKHPHVGFLFFSCRGCNSITFCVTFYYRDIGLNQFASFWRPVVHLDIKVW